MPEQEVSEMFTVVIYDSKLNLSVEEHSRMERLFRPFTDNSEGVSSVCLCKWEKTGQKIDDAVPTLYQSIAGHPLWRAIVVAERSYGGTAPSVDGANPYDFELPYSTNDEGEPIVPDIIRLTYMLSGYPPLGVLGYRNAYAYFDPEKKERQYIYDADGEVVYQSEFDSMPASEKRKLLNSIDANIEITEEDLVRVVAKEKHPAEVEEKHREKTRLYAFRDERPQEVILLTLYETPDYECDDMGWCREEGQGKEEPDDFCLKHNYPSNCRFLAYNIRNQRHTLYKRDLWKFWLLALTFSVNDLPGTSLQAHQLYKANLDIDQTKLRFVFERYLMKLSAAQAALHEIKLPAMEEVYDAETSLVPLQKVSVMFDSISDDRLVVGTTRIGFAADCPQSEIELWKERTSGCRKVIEEALLKPRERVAFRAAEMRERIDSFADREHLLDRFEVEAVERRIEELEPQVMNAKVYGKLDVNAYRQEAAQADEKVRKVMATRLARRNIVALGIIALLVYLCGFAPYLISAARISEPIFGAALLLAGSALFLLAICIVAVLWMLHRRLIKAIKKYNQTNRNMINRINEGAYDFSEYFTNVCTYMFAKSLLIGAVLKKDKNDTQEKLKKAHLRMIHEEKETAKHLCALYGVELNIPPAPPDFNFIDFEANRACPSENRLYLLPPNSESETLRLGNTGEMLYAPYMFLERIDLECVNARTTRSSNKFQ
jgi:hypothetical protein